MAEKKPDPTSDAARTDGKNADEHRDALKKEAEKGLKKAGGTLPKDPS